MKKLFSIMRAAALLGMAAAAITILCGGNAMSQTKFLNIRQAAIIPIAAFTANGDEARLADALKAGLNDGLSINDIREVLVQMEAYAGFPRSLTGLSVFMDVLEQRKASGIKDIEGEAPKHLPKGVDRNAMGAKTQTELVGAPVNGPLFDFSPASDAFLKEHLFCDIFSRGVLTNQEREIATVAALAILPAPAQLAAHLAISMNTGLTPDQLREEGEILERNVSAQAGKLELEALAKTLAKTK